MIYNANMLCWFYILTCFACFERWLNVGEIIIYTPTFCDTPTFIFWVVKTILSSTCLKVTSVRGSFHYSALWGCSTLYSVTRAQRTTSNNTLMRSLILGQSDQVQQVVDRKSLGIGRSSARWWWWLMLVISGHLAGCCDRRCGCGCSGRTDGRLQRLQMTNAAAAGQRWRTHLHRILLRLMPLVLAETVETATDAGGVGACCGALLHVHGGGGEQQRSGRRCVGLFCVGQRGVAVDHRHRRWVRCCVAVIEHVAIALESVADTQALPATYKWVRVSGNNCLINRPLQMQLNCTQYHV